MVPVTCNCANNKNGVCYGKASTADINAVMSNWEGTVTDGNGVRLKGMAGCPGYLAVDQEPYEGVSQGDVKIGPND